MKTRLMILTIIITSIQTTFSQESDGVASFDLPVRNALVFNRFAINPTFSFVREQNKYITFSNKREWVQFENAPVTFIGSYSGRFSENIGAGVAAFKQNFGVLTTFGGVLNMAYNVKLRQYTNLTFGLNVGAYSSGINTGNVIANFDDPSLQNVPSNFMMTVNPGVNFGTEFLDFGVSLNNLVLYNFETSEMIEDDPEQSIRAHVMHTGYFYGNGIFDNAKFTGALFSDFGQDDTTFSGIASLSTPKGIWVQVGYNTRYGASGGLGINLTKSVAIEYNIEKAMGELNDFGISHEFTLAYRIQSRNNYDYNGDEEVTAVFNKKRRKPVKPSDAELAGIRERAAQRRAQAQLDREAEEAAQLKTQEDAAEAKRIADQKAKEEAEARAKELAEQRAKQEAEAEVKRLAEQKAREEAQAEAKRLAAERAKQKAEAEARAKQLAEEKAKQEAEAEAQRLAEEKARQEAEAEAQRLAEEKAKQEAEAEAEAQRLAEEKAKQEAIANPQDDNGKSLLAAAKATEASTNKQARLLEDFEAIVDIKNKDLKDLKEENDLSDQGITVAPRPFKSVTAENNKLNAIKSDLDQVIDELGDNIEELKSLYEERTRIQTIELDEVSLFYKKKIKDLSDEQSKALQIKEQLEARLETIRIATEFEKRRRIKRAEFDNNKDRYEQDRAALENIKRTTSLSDTPLKSEDFDFGEAGSNNIQILKGIENADNGYYLIVAIHSDIYSRNEFVKKVVASGRTNVDFFYDVNTSKYYIYYDKFGSIEQANQAMEAKGNRPYNIKMSLVKIEN